jgi:hypothetical protein
MAVLLYLLGCYGLTTIIVQSKIIEPIRLFFKKKVVNIYRLITCMMCTGFWVGVVTTIGFGFSVSYSFFHTTEINLIQLIGYTIFDGGIVSGVVWLIYLIQLNLERYVKDEL